VSSGYLTATPGSSNLTGVYSPNKAITVTPVIGKNGSFYVVRHTDYQLTSSTPYTLTLPTSIGNITIPALGGSLTLSRRDSKIHVTDYPVGDATVVYSTAEIFTWQKFDDKTVLVVYGGPGELHEIAIKGGSTESKLTGTGVTTTVVDDDVVLAQWQTSTARRILEIGDVVVYILGKS
jgi:hypothetical protein